VYCESCGNGLGEGASFCSRCGRSTSAPAPGAVRPVRNTAPSKPNATYGWLIASEPAINFLLALIFNRQLTSQMGQFFLLLIGAAIVIALGALDLWGMKRADLLRPGFAFWAIAVPPVYLFLRARITNSHKGMFALWMAQFGFWAVIFALAMALQWRG
jgi:hypothetical protein